MEAAGVHEPDQCATTAYAFFSRPNRSLTRRQQNRVVLIVAMPCVGIALVFATLGYWLVLPFAGLEVGLLLWAFAHLRGHDADYESITICGDRLYIEWRTADKVHRRELNTVWTRIEAGRHGGFCLCSHGEATELGRYLSEEQRVELLAALRARLARPHEFTPHELTGGDN
jgi:uncharacterized membrane protein